MVDDATLDELLGEEENVLGEDVLDEETFLDDYEDEEE